MEQIQKASGLHGVNRQTFLERLRLVCDRHALRYPCLTLWIRKRTALLDLHSALNQGNLEAHRIQFKLLLGLLEAMECLRRDPRRAAITATEVAQDALSSAAAVAAQVLGPTPSVDPAELSANLMIPVALPDEAGPRLDGTPLASRNAADAAELWKPYACAVDKALLVAVETRGAGYLGFWLPLARGHEGAASLPGAGTAFLTGHGAAVFKDDLPALHRDFDEALAAKWNQYMRTTFREDLFVSLPFVLTDPDSGVGQPLAVFNVNAISSRSVDWKRAYHQDGLTVAAIRTYPLIGLALSAVLVRISAQEEDQRIAIDTGVPLYDRFLAEREAPKGGGES